MRSKNFLIAIALAALASPLLGQDYPHYRAAASTFVPLDSWVYPVLERLSALGYATTALSDEKPWTRIECARLTEEVGEAVHRQIFEGNKPLEIAVRLHAALEREFSFELEVLGGGRTRSLRAESIYTRVLSVSGPPLTDGFHFGQTIGYDFGRPFRRGANLVTGAAGRATAGRIAFYVRGEFQHSPSAPPLSDAVLDLIALRDEKPRETSHPFASVNRMHLLDAYATFNVMNWQLSIGKQSLSWGPGEGGSLLLSDNADPLYMVRLTRVLPARLPFFLKYLGPIRSEFFVTRLHGLTVARRPFMLGRRFSIKPTPYLEIGYGTTAIFGGGLDPVTFGTVYRVLFGINRQGRLPADGRESLDWTLRVPGLHDSVVLYGELYSDDQALPFRRINRSPFRPGLYFPHIPRLSKLDFRIEAASTESPGAMNHGSLNYRNPHYPDGYINSGNLMGNTVGREGTAIQAWSTYWFSPENRLQFGFKRSTVDSDYIPGGGSWHDYSVRHEMHIRTGIYVRSLFQFEHIGRYPLLFNGKTNNVTASLEIGFIPDWARGK